MLRPRVPPSADEGAQLGLHGRVAHGVDVPRHEMETGVGGQNARVADRLIDPQALLVAGLRAEL